MTDELPPTAPIRKAVSYSGGTAIGAFLMSVVDYIPDEKIKATVLILVPGLSIATSEVAQWICKYSKKSSDAFFYDRQLNLRIKRIKRELAEGVDDPKLKADLQAALNEAKRERALRKVL